MKNTSSFPFTLPVFSIAVVTVAEGKPVATDIDPNVTSLPSPLDSLGECAVCGDVHQWIEFKHPLAISLDGYEGGRFELGFSGFGTKPIFEGTVFGFMRHSVEYGLSIYAEIRDHLWCIFCTEKPPARGVRLIKFPAGVNKQSLHVDLDAILDPHSPCRNPNVKPGRKLEVVAPAPSSNGSPAPVEVEVVKFTTYDNGHSAKFYAARLPRAVNTLLVSARGLATMPKTVTGALDGSRATILEDLEQTIVALQNAQKAFQQ